VSQHQHLALSFDVPFEPEQLALEEQQQLEVVGVVQQQLGPVVG